MANVLVEETSLSNIASAIRVKNGSTAVYKPGEMAAAITNLPTGGGDTETITFSTDISFLFASNGGGALYETVKNKNLVFTNIHYGRGVFYNMPTNDTITPFTIHLLQGVYRVEGNVDFRGFYEGSSVASNIVIDPPIEGATITNEEFKSFFAKSRLKNIDLSCIDTNYQIFSYNGAMNLFSESGHLRSINFTNSPHKYFGGNNIQYYSTFYRCFDLDSIEDLYTTKQTDFFNAFIGCSHLAKLTFKTASPTNAKNPYYSSDIDLSTLGYYTSISEGYEETDSTLHYGNKPLFAKSLVRQNAAKEITNATTYAKLKNDPDAWTTNVAYSRYNKTSAKETLTSLPYIKEARTIKFNGEAGSATDGGAIKNLTSSEIAAATAKKWTVAFA